MKGFFPKPVSTYMRGLAVACADLEVVQQPVAQLPWGRITVLLDRLGDPALRAWYADQAVAQDWPRNVLEHHIKTGAHERFEAASSNLNWVLERVDSDLAQHLTKDPYVLDFLAVDGDAKECEFEQGLADRIIDTPRELGGGFAFVGRQVHFDVDGDDFHVDLLFFHVEQLR